MKPLVLSLQLLKWSEDTNGRKVVFEVLEDPDLPTQVEHPFKNFTANKGKVAGQIFFATFTQYDPGTGKVVEEAKASGKRLRSGEDAAADASTPVEAFDADAATNARLNSLCADKHISRPKSHFPTGLCGLAIKWCEDPHFAKWVNEQMEEPVDPKNFILSVCGVTSRKELDTDADAGRAFREEIMGPYSVRREVEGVDKGNF